MNAVATKARIALKNILFATDFSPAAEAALPYAIGLAKQYGAKVHGLHVRFPATYPIVGPEAMPQVLEAPARNPLVPQFERAGVAVREDRQ